jgi:hypothetical protein
MVSSRRLAPSLGFKVWQPDSIETGATAVYQPSTIGGTPSQWCQAKENFYQDPTTNHYSKAIHANAIGALAYAFQSDDHCDVSSYVSLINPSVLAITLNN